MDIFKRILIMLVVFCTFYINTESVCASPVLTEPGLLVSPDHVVYDEMDLIILYCDPSLYLLHDGPAFSFCMSGLWVEDPTLAVCHEACDPPATDPDVAHTNQKTGESAPDYYLHDAMVEYTCKDELGVLDGTSTATCHDGVWDPPDIPVCRDECMSPDNVYETGSYRHGTSVFFICLPGTVSNGNSLVRCLDGEWSDAVLCSEPIPTTAIPPKELTTVYSPITCQKPHFRKDNVYINPVQEFGYRDFDVVYFYCNETMSYVAYVALCYNGSWVPNIPEKICHDPCAIPVAEGLNYTLKAGLTDGIIYTHGSDISYTCESARHIITSSTCDDGSWIPRVECPEYTTPGIHTTSNFLPTESTSELMTSLLPTSVKTEYTSEWAYSTSSSTSSTSGSSRPLITSSSKTSPTDATSSYTETVLPHLSMTAITHTDRSGTGSFKKETTSDVTRSEVTGKTSPVEATSKGTETFPTHTSLNIVYTTLEDYTGTELFETETTSAGTDSELVRTAVPLTDIYSTLGKGSTVTHTTYVPSESTSFMLTDNNFTESTPGNLGTDKSTSIISESFPSTYTTTDPTSLATATTVGQQTLRHFTTFDSEATLPDATTAESLTSRSSSTHHFTRMDSTLQISSGKPMTSSAVFTTEATGERHSSTLFETEPSVFDTTRVRLSTDMSFTDTTPFLTSATVDASSVEPTGTFTEIFPSTSTSTAENTPVAFSTLGAETTAPHIHATTAIHLITPDNVITRMRLAYSTLVVSSTMADELSKEPSSTSLGTWTASDFTRVETSTPIDTLPKTDSITLSDELTSTLETTSEHIPSSLTPLHPSTQSRTALAETTNGVLPGTSSMITGSMYTFDTTEETPYTPTDMPRVDSTSHSKIETDFTEHGLSTDPNHVTTLPIPSSTDLTKIRTLSGRTSQSLTDAPLTLQTILTTEIASVPSGTHSFSTPLKNGATSETITVRTGETVSTRASSVKTTTFVLESSSTEITAALATQSTTSSLHETETSTARPGSSLLTGVTIGGDHSNNGNPTLQYNRGAENTWAWWIYLLVVGGATALVLAGVALIRYKNRKNNNQNGSLDTAL